MLFESRIAQNHMNRNLLWWKWFWKPKKPKIISDDKNYNNLTFDVIKRGSLLLLEIGLSFARLCFAYEFISFIISTKQLTCNSIDQ